MSQNAWGSSCCTLHVILWLKMIWLDMTSDIQKFDFQSENSNHHKNNSNRNNKLLKTNNAVVIIKLQLPTLQDDVWLDVYCRWHGLKEAATHCIPTHGSIMSVLKYFYRIMTWFCYYDSMFRYDVEQAMTTGMLT